LTRELVEKSRKENGCIDYSINRSTVDDCVYAFIEIWENEDVLAPHRNSEHFKRLVPQINELCEDVGTTHRYIQL